MKILECGYCKQKKYFVDGKGLKTIKFPARVFIIPLEDTYLLFDSGYPADFENLKKHFGIKIYNKFLPVTMSKEKSCLNQLKLIDIKREEIKYIFISHFHLDHIGGLKDFPNTQFICSKEEYKSFNNTKGIKSIFKAYFKYLLPKNFEERVLFIEDKFKIEGIDFIHLPGHTFNQYGLFIKKDNILLAADSIWSEKAYTKDILPPLISECFMEDKKSYKKTIKYLADLHKKGVKILSTHG